jgi:hypothetical protein
MTTSDSIEVSRNEGELRIFVRLVLAGFGLLGLAGLLLWWRFGSTIFFDALAALQGCF